MHKHDYNKKAQMSSGHGSIRFNIILQRPHTEESLLRDEGCSSGSLPILLLHRKDCSTGAISEAATPVSNTLLFKRAHTYQIPGVAKQTVQGLAQ